MPAEIERRDPQDLEIIRANSDLSEARDLMKGILENPYYKGSWKNGKVLISIDPEKSVVKTRRGSEDIYIEEHFKFSKDFFSHETFLHEGEKTKKVAHGMVLGEFEDGPEEVESGIEMLWHIAKHVMPKLLKREMSAPQPQPVTFH